MEEIGLFLETKNDPISPSSRKIVGLRIAPIYEKGVSNG